MASILTQEMRDAISVESAPRTHVAEAGAIRRFAEAVGDHNPQYPDGIVAPPTFLRSLDDVPPVPEFDIPYPDILDGGSDWEFFMPVRAGDEITSTTKLVDVFEKTGSLGDILFVVREHRYVNQNEKTAAVQKSTTIYYRADRPSPHPSPGRERGQETDRTAANQTQRGPLYVEDVSEGAEIPTLIKVPTTRQLVQYAGASGDFYEIHYDREFSRSSGLPDVIVHGALKSAFLAQMLTDWIGDQGVLRKLSVQYRGMDVVGRPILCQGIVRSKPSSIPNGTADQNLSIVECDVWIETENGTKTTVGTAAVSVTVTRR